MKRQERTCIATLFRMTSEIPEPHLHYVTDSFGEHGVLTPDSGLALTDRAWQEFIEQHSEESDGILTYDYSIDLEFVNWLRHHALAWQSFMVLEGIANAIATLSRPASCDEVVDHHHMAVLLHAHRLLDKVLASNVEGTRLIPDRQENEPAFRLLELLSEVVQDDAAIPVLTTLLEFSPGDVATRSNLAHLMIAAGRPGDALHLCDEVPRQPCVALVAARILSLYHLDRHDEALKELRLAYFLHGQFFFVLINSLQRSRSDFDIWLKWHEAEAWLEYRDRWFALWESSGALAWLRSMQLALRT